MMQEYTPAEKKVLICGSRHWTNRELIRAWVDKLKCWGYTTVIEGEAPGADTIARQEAVIAGMHVIPVPANWAKYGRAAGPIRNTEMLSMDPDLVVAFHEDITKSKGTKNMVQLARYYNVQTIVIDQEGKEVNT